MNFKKLPVGSLWYGFRVFTVLTAAILFWLALIGGIFALFNGDYWLGSVLFITSALLSLFSRSLEKAILEEDAKKEKVGKDDDFNPPSGMNFV